MEKKPIVIDMEIVIDPYKLLSIINGVDKIYSEIVIPSPLQYIEIWHPKWRMFTFRPFEDESIMDRTLASVFGYSNEITNNNFVVGMQLLRLAKEKGMVRVLDLSSSFKYEKAGKEILNVRGNFNNIKRITLGDPGRFLYINPDYPISEMLVGMQYDGYNVIYGNDEFLYYWKNEGQDWVSDLEHLRTPFCSMIDGKLQTLIYTNKINDVEDAFKYVGTQNYFKKLEIELRNTVEDYQAKKEMFLLTLEYASTTIGDTIFQAPVLTTSLFTFRVVKRLLKRK